MTRAPEDKERKRYTGRQGQWNWRRKRTISGIMGRKTPENVDSVPLRTATAASMNMSPSPTEERPIKKRTGHNIRRGIAAAATVS